MQNESITTNYQETEHYSNAYPDDYGEWHQVSVDVERQIG